MSNSGTLKVLREELGTAREGRRLPVGPGGPKHRRQENDESVQKTRAAIIRAVVRLKLREGRESYPSADRIVAEGAGEFGRSRVFDHLDLVHAAVDEWHKTEAQAGRKTRRRARCRLAAAKSDTATSSQALAQKDAEILELKSKLKRALEEVVTLNARIGRLTAEVSNRSRQIERMSIGLYQKLWPRRTPEAIGTTQSDSNLSDIASRSADEITDVA